MRNLFFPFSCDEFSNCRLGNPKVIKTCTIFSPRVCDGCQDGNYFNRGAGVNGGCEECSPPCNFFEDETQPCTTDHDRTCSAKTTVPTPPAISKFIPFFRHVFLIEGTRSTRGSDARLFLKMTLSTVR